jgi:hypothetical protein
MSDCLDTGLKLKPWSATVQIDWNARSPAEYCSAEPCPVCGACSVCQDFHAYTGCGCTDETCPYLKRRSRP